MTRYGLDILNDILGVAVIAVMWLFLGGLRGDGLARSWLTWNLIASGIGSAGVVWTAMQRLDVPVVIYHTIWVLIGLGPAVMKICGWFPPEGTEADDAVRAVDEEGATS